MSWARALDGVAAIEAGYRLHRLGLAGRGFETTPGYARAEEQLRRVTRVRLPQAVVWASVREALGGAAPSEDAADRAWYLKRRDAGEGRESEPLASAVAALFPTWRPPHEVAFLVSPALRPMPCLAPAAAAECGGGAVVAAGPGMPRSLGLLGAAALGVEAAVSAALPEDIVPESVHFVVCMVAGSLLVRAGLEGAALEELLVDANRVLVPPQHREGVIERRIQALVRHGLIDQPPGEIERTIHGLARRRPDRLHRAWLRNFFVPRGLAVPGLVG